MNFNVYLDDDLVRRLEALAKRTGTRRNALVRQAVAAWVGRAGTVWPAVVAEWRGDPSVIPFESARPELAEPVPDPLAPESRRASRTPRRRRRARRR